MWRAIPANSAVSTFVSSLTSVKCCICDVPESRIMLWQGICHPMALGFEMTLQFTVTGVQLSCNKFQTSSKMNEFMGSFTAQPQAFRYFCNSGADFPPAGYGKLPFKKFWAATDIAMNPKLQYLQLRSNSESTTCIRYAPVIYKHCSCSRKWKLKGRMIVTRSQETWLLYCSIYPLPTSASLSMLSATFHTFVLLGNKCDYVDKWMNLNSGSPWGLGKRHSWPTWAAALSSVWIEGQLELIRSTLKVKLRLPTKTQHQLLCKAKAKFLGCSTFSVCKVSEYNVYCIWWEKTGKYCTYLFFHFDYFFIYHTVLGPYWERRIPEFLDVNKYYSFKIHISRFSFTTKCHIFFFWRSKFVFIYRLCSLKIKWLWSWDKT